jgi:hypothetical protein
MTTLEALNIEVGSKSLAEKYLIQQGIISTDTYSVSNHAAVELAKAYCYRALVNMPDWSEDGLSITYSREYMLNEANRIFTENGLTDAVISVQPTISNGTGLW